MAARLKFGPDGLLYIGVGDGGGGNDQHGTIGNAQDKFSLLGKILRIDVDHGGSNPYAIPPGNPYATGVGGLKEIFTYGMRNPWRFSFDRATGDFWVGDVGQDHVEEVDLLPAGTGAGANLGWRIMEGDSCTGLTAPPSLCTDPTLTAPILKYTHASGCSITGGYVYRGHAVPALAGRYLYADFCSGRIWAAQKIGAAPWSSGELDATGYNISTFGEDEAGELYFTNYATGDIYQFVDSGSTTPILTTSATALAFGNVTVGDSSNPQTFNVTNVGGGTLTLTGLTPGGASPSAFTRSGTCAIGSALTASQSCSVIYQFTPTVFGAQAATLAVASGAGNATIALTGAGTPRPVFGVSAIPTAVDFGGVAVGGTSVAQTITVRNTGTASLTLSGVNLQGNDANNFAFTGFCAAGMLLISGETCTVDVTFHPLAVGARMASLDVAFGATAPTASVVLTGSGGTTAPDVVGVIEYYHAGFDHYFITSLANEIAALDSGQFAGWSRTQKTFKAWSAAQSGTSPVCRFYIPPALGDSHFFSASPVECSEASVKFPTFIAESSAVMHEFLPDPVSGACPANTVPIYRVWNQRADSNHRYTNERSIRDSMVAKGYVAEGYGTDAVVMCGPR